jgi:uncharacterized protein YjbI with pentapeptide repeats
MLRYICLSLFALLLLTACGGSGGSDLDQAGGEEPVTDASSKDLNKAFENQTGSLGYGETEPTPTTAPFPTPGYTSASTENTGSTNSEVGPITAEIENNVDKLIETKSCPECDLSDANLSGADLSGANLSGAILFLTNLSDADLTNANLYGADLQAANLTEANLTGADLTGADLAEADLTGANLTDAILDDVIGADFTGALGVPAKYLKD